MSGEREPRPPEELIQGYFDGALSPEDGQRLNEWLSADAAHVAEFVGQLQVHASLWERSVAARDDRQPGEAGGRPQRLGSRMAISVRPPARSASSRRAARRRGGYLAVLALAAAAAAALLVVWLSSGGQKENAAQAGPTIAVLSGQADLLRGDARLAAATGLQLQVGDQVETRAAARATLRYPNGTTVEMNEQTLAGICAGGLTMDRGDIYVRAAGPMAVNRGQYDEVVVAGTEFEVSRRAAATDLRVAEGRVSFGRGSTAAVGAMQASRIAPDGSPSAPEAVELGKIAPWRVPPDDGLVGYWKFDEGAGAVANDSSGQNNHGAIHGAAWDKGRFGSALRFNGKDDCFVDVGRGPSLSIPDHVTMAMWINILERPQRAPGIDSSYGLLGPPRNDFRNYNLAVAPVGLQDSQWGFILSTGDQNTDPIGYWRRNCEPQTIELGRWHHVAGIISKNDGGRFAFFLDGKPIGEERNLGFTSLCTKGSAPLLIGRTHYTFCGLIDEVRIYRRVLSAEEIARLAGDSR